MSEGAPQASGEPNALVVVDAAPRRAGLVKSAGRVLQILEFFDDVQREARVAEIAERLEFPQSSTSVLLKCLTELGYLDYDPASRSFLPSPRVALLGTWLDKGPARDGRLIRTLEELSRRTGDTVILAARNGIYSQYIHVLQARTAMRFHVPPGARRLAVWSGTGFALLSRMEDETVRALCRRTNAEAPPDQPKVNCRGALENVGRVRRDGYFFSRGLVTAGAGSIAMPLPSGIDQRDRPLAVAISGPLDDFVRRENAIVQLMRGVVARYLGPQVATREGGETRPSDRGGP